MLSQGFEPVYILKFGGLWFLSQILGSERTERNMRICTIHLAEDKVQRVSGYDPGNGPSVSAGGWEFLHQLRDYWLSRKSSMKVKAPCSSVNKWRVIGCYRLPLHFCLRNNLYILDMSRRTDRHTDEVKITSANVPKDRLFLALICF